MSHLTHPFGTPHLKHRPLTCVITADPGQIVVLALMFDLSTEASDPIIAGLTPHLSAITEAGTKTAIEAGLDFANVVAQLQTSNIFQYTGSLTTPPCSEGVIFLAMETPLKLSVPDFNAIKKVVKFNSRVTQNVLGSENIIAVAGLSGASAATNETAAEEEQATATEAPVAGETIVVTELSGVPMATPITGHVAARARRVRRQL